MKASLFRIHYYGRKRIGVFSNPSSNRVFAELGSQLSNCLLTSGLRVRISRGFFSRYYHKVINLGNKSKARFFKVYLTYRIDEADGTNLPIHSGCLPVFPIIIIHSDDLDFVSRFHGSEIKIVLIFFFDGFLSSHSERLYHQKVQELFGHQQ